MLHGEVLDLVSAFWDSMVRRQCSSTRKGVILGAGEGWGDLMEAISEKRRIKRVQAQDWI